MTSLTSTGDIPKGHTPNNKMLSENRNLASELEFYKNKFEKYNNK